MPLHSKIFFFSILLIPHIISAKEMLTIERIEAYLTEDNPYVYSAVGQHYIDTARIQTAQGTFDTVLAIEQDTKEYPVSTGEFLDVTLSKPIENGTELIVGYRKAQGVQEYNNIKTGDQGETRIGIKVPLFEVLEGMNKRKYGVNTASLQATQSLFLAENNLRNLYSNVLVSYYRLLYFHEVVQLEKRLLSKAERRNHFIQKRVHSGDMPELTLMESQQQIINRQQRLLIQENHYHNALKEVLKYLNLSTDTFNATYHLPSIKTLKREKIVLDHAMNEAVKNRPDFKVLETKKKKLALDNTYNEVAAYPKVNLFAYGVEDAKYGEGTKVGFNLQLPLERRGYEGKKVEIQKGVTQIGEEKKRLELELQTNLTNLIYSQERLNHNIQMSHQEIEISQTLERAEETKYNVGSSNLYQLNLREIQTLEVEQKQLEYYLNAFLIHQEIQKEMAIFKRL